MTKDEIMQMAEECGFTIEEGWVMCLDENKRPYMELPSLRRFADLVAKGEREACAKLVEPRSEWRIDPPWGYLGGTEGVELLDSLAAAIRARGQT